ncbi:hypothetical protein C8R45DRAFT_566121 [Mycena sanguinolenta]|nr:hypothetical protein C8R45DRAFT_566121 [Mycena sanguinolenta]
MSRRLSLRYTPTTTHASPPGQGSPYSYGDQAYGYGGNYSEMDDQRMHAFPQASSPPPFVLGSTPTPPPQKKKEAHTTAVMNLPAEKQEWDWIPKGTDTRDPDVLQTAAEKKQMRMLWERERRKWGKAPPPVAEVMPPGAAEFQHSVRTTPHPFHPSTSPSTVPLPSCDPLPVIPILEFKRKGALWVGINLIDAQSTQTKLAGNADYTLQDLHADQRGRIHVRVDWEWFLPSLKWSSDSPLTYEIHLDVDDGRIIMEALLRRVARACVDYLESNMVSFPYDRVQLRHLEKIAPGVWQPMLSISDRGAPTVPIDIQTIGLDYLVPFSAAPDRNVLSRLL